MLFFPLSSFIRMCVRVFLVWCFTSVCNRVEFLEQIMIRKYQRGSVRRMCSVSLWPIKGKAHRHFMLYVRGLTTWPSFSQVKL